jgi:hypothetical protein
MRLKRQRAFQLEGPLEVVRLAGFEPTTPWFVAKYSIQLSYSRTQKRNYSQAYSEKEGVLADLSNFLSTGLRRKKASAW